MTRPLSKEREFYIDNLRVYLTILVILHHTAITYGAPGAWYYSEQADGRYSYLSLTAFVATNQSFFMGMFFFLSAYFIPASLYRKGTSAFITERFKRLGTPIVFYSLVISPVTIYLMIILTGKANVSFLDYYVHRDDWISLGVLWFTTALLLFTVVFICIDYIFLAKVSRQQLPSNRSIFLFAVALGIISFLIRVVFPIGWSLPPLGFQLAHFTQYIALYSLGIIAYRNNWLLSLKREQGKLWLWLTSALILAGLPGIYFLKEVTHTELGTFLGGFTIQSFVNAMWEQVTGIAIIITLLLVAKYRWNTQSNFMKVLSRSAYAVYIIHPLILVCVSLLLKEIDINSLLKFLITGSLSIILSFTTAALLVRIPLIKGVI